LISNSRQIHAKLEIQRPDSSWVDVSDYLVRAEVNLGNVDQVGTGNAGVDGVVRTMSFTLQNSGALIPAWDEATAQDETYVVGDELDVVGDELDGAEVLINLLFGTTNEWARNSFSPKDANSEWNQPSPLLWPNRRVRFQVAVTAVGATPTAGDWVTLHEGYLGDLIRTDAHTVTCECRDLAKRLQDAYIETSTTYTDMDAEDVIQQILDDYFGAGEITLYTPVASGWHITSYTVEYVSVWDAIQKIAAQRGWFLGYRWDSGTGQFRLTFMEPPRSKSTADYTINYTDDIYVEDLDISDRDIRNVVKVTYQASDGSINTVTREDATSISIYGRRACEIIESATSEIDTQAEAEALADAVLSDLKDLSGTTRIEMPLFPELDLFDMLEVTNPLISSSADLYAVESVRHTLDFDSGSFTTEVIASGKVIGGRRKWLSKETRPGAKKPIETGEVENEAITKAKTVAQSLSRAAAVVVAPANSSAAGKASADYVCDGQADQVEINSALSESTKVILLEGDYIVNGNIHMKTNSTLEGQGEATRIKVEDNHNADIYVITNTDASNYVIKNLTLDGNLANNSEGIQIGIRVTQTSDVQINSVICTNFRTLGIFLDRSSSVIVTECRVTGNDTGIYAGWCSDTIVSHNHSKGNATSGIVFFDDSSVNIINDNNISHNGHNGIQLLDSNNNIVQGNIVYSNSQATDLGYANILVYGSSYNNIQNNVVRKGDEVNRPAYGIQITSTSQENLVTNNDLLNAGEIASILDEGTGTVTVAGNRV